MKKILIVVALFISLIGNAQSKGTVTGVLTDKEYNNDPLPFANVLIKGTTLGTTTDFDGIYTLSLEP
ncbi:carboxypeptidase-like regulatory domain-containing protein [Polaribacter sp. HL-MS24]|uniref:carboxypeptidase-like regulatory domain-containing protein n=1 Tax=Polaribacter sp. HL-MS24 TaxID=3077735 RepID=UPI0029347798|nr:carboxypeptidase-like regulatory domain-containing protein [Polaribacter sp. HL-MS24]WOC40954.1 carboxypeptidase-like regulatory domain-containing protein [Polaribacter sp. HL-MS24]